MFAFEPHDPQLPATTGLPTSEPFFHEDGAAHVQDRVAADDMDIEEPMRLARNLTRSPPIHVASMSPARAPVAQHAPVPGLPEKLNFDQVRSNAAKKKKKKRANKANAAAPALQTIRGFQTPVTSGGEESDMSAFSTPRLAPKRTGLDSITSSPALRPTSAQGGISNIKTQLDKLSLGSTGTKSYASTTNASSNGSVLSSNSSESGKTELDSFEVDLDEDLVSPDADEKSSLGGLTKTESRQDSFSRKMCAEDFDTISCLGKGSYGTVLLVKQRGTGRLFAQKQLRKAHLTGHKKLVEQTKTERIILENVNRHPFVVKLYYAFQDHEKLYLILEYAQGGELFHHLAMERMFTEEVAAYYMAEMVLALEHLHRTVGVVYRDLKPENCLLDSEGHLLLTDFGLSKVTVDEGDTCNSMLGTAEYMAPEVILGKDYGMAVDWWSLGALGFDLLTGSPPFTANNNAKVQEKIVKQKLQLPYFLGPDAKDLLTRLLRKEPSKRLGANMPKDLQAIKSHRFFRKINWAKLAKRELEPPIRPLITDPELAENFSKDFTELAVSPTVESKPWPGADMEIGGESELFGGFSFVASSSLLQCGDWGVGAF